MTMTAETLSALLDHELRRALDRLAAARREIDADIAAIESEIERRRVRRRKKQRAQRDL
jgi:hypothetical protein